MLFHFLQIILSNNYLIIRHVFSRVKLFYCNYVVTSFWVVAVDCGWCTTSVVSFVHLYGVWIFVRLYESTTRRQLWLSGNRRGSVRCQSSNYYYSVEWRFQRHSLFGMPFRVIILFHSPMCLGSTVDRCSAKILLCCMYGMTICPTIILCSRLKAMISERICAR